MRFVIGIWLQEDGEDKSEKPEVLMFKLSPRAKAFVALMPVPVPQGEADDAARFSISGRRYGVEVACSQSALSNKYG